MEQETVNEQVAYGYGHGRQGFLTSVPAAISIDNREDGYSTGKPIRQSTDLWGKSLAALNDKDKEQLNVLVSHPGKTSLEDILADVGEKMESCMRKRWKYERNGKVVILRDICDKIMKWVDRFKQIGDIVMQYDPGHAALPWALFRFLLQAAVNDSQVFGAMAEGLERVSRLVTEYAIVEALYLSEGYLATDQMTEAIIRLYSAILVYFAKACQFYNRSAFGRFASGVTQTVEGSVDIYLRRISEEEEKVASFAVLIDAEYRRKVDIFMLDQIQSLRALILSPRLSIPEQRKGILQWLGAVFTDQGYHMALSSRLRGTCQWISRRPEFQSWLTPQPDMAKVLWIRGGPGYGKTVLAASLIEYLKDLRETVLAPAICFFFCAFEDQAKRDPSAIIRSWVAQLVNQQDDVLKIACQLYKGNEARPATDAEIWELFRRSSKEIPNSVFVVDGFDECIAWDTIGFNHKTRFLEQLWNCSADTASRILIVSRDDAGIRSFVRSARLETILPFEYDIVPNDTKEDIGSFSTSIVSKRLKFKRDESFIDEIAQEATRRSGGMFLWVRLLEKLLSPGKNPDQLRKVLLEMPEGLEQTYRRELQIISDLNSEEKERAIAILRWTYFAARPLTVRELTEALVTDIDSSSTYRFGDLPDTWDEDYVNEQIRMLCGSLIEIRGSRAGQSIATQTVHFVHSSVKDFLSKPVRSNLNWKISFSQAASEHALLAKVCLSYICYDDIMKEYKYAANDLQKKIDCFQFLSYAAQMWLFHLSLSGAESKDLTSHIKKLFDPATSHWVIPCELFEASNESFDDLDPETKLDPPTPLYYAALTGLSETLEWLLSLGVDVNASGGRYGHALQAAAVKGNKEALKTLLANGADVNKHGGMYGYAIVAAAANWPSADTEEIVELLLEAGADTAYRDLNGMNPLDYAAESGSKRIVGFLLGKGAEVNAAKEDGLTALFLATRHGHESVVRLLIEHGADVEVRAFRWTPLHLAALTGHEAVVQLLIKHGADVNVNNEGRTPLHLAASRGHEAVVQLLIELGANVNAKNYGWTPLRDAAVRGDEAIAQLLIERGAEVNVKNVGLTLLHIAAQNGREAVVQILIKNGAEVNIADPNGWTALHHAVENAQDDLVRFLIENGAEVNAGGHTSQTPLHFAIYRGMAEVASILLSLGADPMILDCYGRTCMDWVSDGYQPMRQILSGYISDHCPTDPAISSDILRHSVVNLATELRGRTRALSHQLGHCLIFLNDPQEAITAFGQAIVREMSGDRKLGHRIICSSCSPKKKIYGDRFVCSVCADINLCSSCMAKYETGSFIRDCENHKFLRVSGEDWLQLTGTAVNNLGESREQWLDRLISTYSCEGVGISG